jgi:putative N6-adenine-specific DNA methylase
MTELFITCPEQCEELLVKELQNLKVKAVRSSFRGVFAPQTIENVYRINYGSRLATRVLWPLKHFNCKDKDSLYRASKEIPWLNYLDETKTFAIDSNVSHPNIRNSLYGAQVMKDGVCDRIREEKGARPSVDVKNPDVQLNLFIHNNRGIISLDTSGAPLYKRGWRTLSSVASIQENLAAALLMEARYKSDTILCDPFCGSGTFLIEAALLATKTPAGYFRKSWGFLLMSEHEPLLWEEIKEELNAERIPLQPGKIFGADQDREAIQICQTHLQNVGFAKEIEVVQASIARYRPRTPPTLVVTNPPFGKRLETSKEIYRQLGEFVKRSSPTKVRAWVLAPDEELVSATGLTILSSFPFYHGGLSIEAYTLGIPRT